MGIFELIVMNDELRDMISPRRLDRPAPRRLPQAGHDDAARVRPAGHLRRRQTTIEEVVRETVLEEEA